MTLDDYKLFKQFQQEDMAEYKMWKRDRESIYSLQITNDDLRFIISNLQAKLNKCVASLANNQQIVFSGDFGPEG